MAIALRMLQRTGEKRDFCEKNKRISENEKYTRLVFDNDKILLHTWTRQLECPVSVNEKAAFVNVVGPGRGARLRLRQRPA